MSQKLMFTKSYVFRSFCPFAEYIGLDHIFVWYAGTFKIIFSGLCAKLNVKI